MAHESKIPVFSEQFRQSLVQRRVLVLDGVLDDDNGTVLAAQLLTLADEVMHAIADLSGQEYVHEYASDVKARLSS